MYKVYLSFLFLLLISSSLFPQAAGSSDTSDFNPQPLLQIIENHKWGLIDYTGNIALAPKYDKIMDFDVDGYARVISRGKLGLINRSPKEIIPPSYDKIDVVSKQYSLVHKETEVFIFDLISGQKYGMSKEYEIIEYVFDNTFIAYNDEKWGVINEKNDTILPFKFNMDSEPERCRIYAKDSIIEDNLYICYRNNIFITSTGINLNIYSSKGETIFSVDGSFIEYSPGYIKYATKEGLTGFYSLKNNKHVLEPEYSDISYIIYKSGYLIYTTEEGFQGLFSLKENKDVLKPEYKYIRFLKFDAGYIVYTTKDGLQNFYSLELNETIFRTPYKEIEYFSRDSGYLGYTSSEGLKGLYSLQYNREIIKPEYTRIRFLSNRFIKVSKRDESGIIRNDGVEIVPLEEHEIEINSCFIQTSFRTGWYYGDEFFNSIYNFDGIEMLSGKNIFVIPLDDNLFIAQSFMKTPKGGWEKNDDAGKCIFNKNGEIISLETKCKFNYFYGIIKVYTNEKIKIIWLNDEGRIENVKEIDRANVQLVNEYKEPLDICQKISLKMDADNRDTTAYWHYFKKQDKWGVKSYREKWNAKSETMERTIVIPPSYHKLECMESFKYLIAAKYFTETDIEPYYDTGESKNINWGYFNSRYAFFTDNIIRLGAPAISEIWLDHYKEEFNVAKCVLPASKKFGFMDLNGRMVYKDLDYASDFKKGIARINKGGKLILVKKKNQLNNQGDFSSIFFNTENRDRINLSSKLYLNCAGGQWNYINTKGEKLFNQDFDYAEDYKCGTAIVKKDDKWGVVNDSCLIIAPIYDLVKRVPGKENLFLLYSRICYSGIIDSSGHIITNSEFKKVYSVSENIALVHKEGHNKYFDLLKQNTLHSDYPKIMPFSDGQAAVYKNGKWGYINRNEEVIIPCQYSKAGNFSNGYTWVSNKGKYWYIDTYGKKVFDTVYSYCSDFHNNYAIVKQGNYYGIIDNSGSYLVTPEYSKVKNFSDSGIACLVRRKKSGKSEVNLINTSGKILAKYNEIHEFSEGLARVKKGKKYGYINTSCKEVISPKYFKAGDFHEGLASIKVKKGFRFTGYEYINTKGDIVITPIGYDYKSAGDFKGKFAYVTNTNNNKMVINKSGETVCDKRDYKKYLLLSNNIIAAYYKRKYILLDSLKREIFPGEKFEKIIDFNNNLLLARQSSKWAILNKEGYKITDHIFNSIEQINESYWEYKFCYFAGLADSKGQMLIEPTFRNIKYTGNNIIQAIALKDISYYDLNQGKWIFNKNNQTADQIVTDTSK